MPKFELRPKSIGRAVAIAALTMLSACGTFYVDTTLQDVSPADKAQVATPQPVQMLSPSRRGA